MGSNNDFQKATRFRHKDFLTDVRAAKSDG